MAAPQGNPGGGMFAKYSGEQINQIPAGYVEAMGSMGKAYAQIGASIGNALQGAAAEKVKKENLQASAQGLLDSYTNGDPESAMYSDSTPNHVKQFLDRSFAAGGVDQMSQRDLNAFMAGEQAYNTKIDREIKLRQIAATELTAANKADTGIERLKNAQTVGANINKAISPGVQTSSAAKIPSVEESVNQQLLSSAKQAEKNITGPLENAYNIARTGMESAGKAMESEQAYSSEEAMGSAMVDYHDATKKASLALQQYEAAKPKAQQAFFGVYDQSFKNPALFSSAVQARQQAIQQQIKAQKALYREQVANVAGPEAASMISLTEEDIKYAEMAAKDIPVGKVFTSPEGYGWVWDGQKFEFKTAEQLGNGKKDEITLPNGLDYDKDFGGLKLDDFYKLDSKVQSKILDNIRIRAQGRLDNLKIAQQSGEMASKTLEPYKFFGWKGYVGNETEMRQIINLTTGRKTLEFSIQQVIDAYQRYGVNRTVSPEARAVFRATRPSLIAAVRPMVAGGNQQSDTELRTILAALPMGEDISSLKEYDIAQYRFMKIMFARHYENHMSSVPGLTKENIGAAGLSMDYQSLPSATRSLMDDFATGTGRFAGMDAGQKMSLLKQELDNADRSGNPYKDSSGGKILINSYDRNAFTAPTAGAYIATQVANLNAEQQEAYKEAQKKFPALEAAITSPNGTR